MSAIKDLTGLRFGKLTVIQRDEDLYENDKKFLMWKCKCDCGNIVVLKGKHLKNGNTKSCGCLRSQVKRKYNIYNLSGEYGIGYDVKGKEFWFDLEDYDLIKNYCWYIDSNGYVTANITVGNGKYSRVYLSRLVVGCSEHYVVDHIRVNTKFDNRKSNLRIVTQSKNCMNRSLCKNNTTGVTGVYYRNNKWYSLIMINGKSINLGRFDNFNDAVKARKEAEKEYFGEYSFDNSNQ